MEVEAHLRGLLQPTGHPVLVLEGPRAEGGEEGPCRDLPRRKVGTVVVDLLVTHQDGPLAVERQDEPAVGVRLLVRPDEMGVDRLRP